MAIVNGHYNLLRNSVPPALSPFLQKMKFHILKIEPSRTYRRSASM